MYWRSEYPGSLPYSFSYYPFQTRDTEALYQFSRFYNPSQHHCDTHNFPNPSYSTFRISCLPPQMRFVAVLPPGTSSQ